MPLFNVQFTITGVVVVQSEDETGAVRDVLSGIRPINFKVNSQTVKRIAYRAGIKKDDIVFQPDDVLTLIPEITMIPKSK